MIVWKAQCDFQTETLPTVPANYPIPEVGALVEVEYMYRFEDGALMQPKYKGERSDVEGPVRLDQIKRIKPKSMAA